MSISIETIAPPKRPLGGDGWTVMRYGYTDREGEFRLTRIEFHLWHEWEDRKAAVMKMKSPKC